jgi:NTE family protein
MGRRGLVLSGGGPVGIAWEAGMIAGLAEAGVDLTGCDVVVGTSAGSVVGAQLALGVGPERLVEQQRSPSSGARRSSNGEAPRIPDELIEAFLGTSQDPEATRRRLGELAREADTIPEDEFLASFGSQLGEAAWPEGFVCTAVDAHDGSFLAFDAGAGVPLLRAVAASCAVPGIFPPITIDGRRFMDGGVRSLTNADLAVGCDEVVVLSLIGRAPAGAPADPFTAGVERECVALEEGGATVRVVAPDAQAREGIGPNLMDFSRRAEAVEAGLVQGRAAAAQLAG